MATNDNNEDNSYDSVYAGITLNSLFGDSDICDYPFPNFINKKNKQSEKNPNSSDCCFDLPNSNNMLLGLDLDLLEGEKTEKEGGEKEITEWDQFDNASAAFLGPQLWEKTIPCNSDLKLEYMNLDEFLNENNIDEELIQRKSVSEDRSSVISGEEKSPSSVAPCAVPSLPKAPPDQSFLPEVAFNDPSSQSPSTPPSTSGKAGPIAEYASSPSPVAGPRSPQGPDSPGYSLPDDEVLASVPGEDFDPRIRPFSEDELKPQPMIKKSRKQVRRPDGEYVPTDLKDERYWARRRKNNVAAKRSRDARRTKENQIAMRASFLEKENQNLRIELEKTRTILDSMKKRLSAYETA